MPINFTCPNCGYKKPVSQKLIGRKLKCPKCNQSTRMSDAKVDKQREARMERDLEAAQDQLDRSVGLGMGRTHINQILAMKDGIIDRNHSSRIRDIKARKESARKHFFAAIGSLVISFLFMAISMIVYRLNEIANFRTTSNSIESQR